VVRQLWEVDYYAEILDLRQENQRLRERIILLGCAIEDLLDGLDSNYDERCGLSSREWDERIANARQILRGKELSDG
jgi:hypothetical protein